jgi:hypothetical protein
MDVVEIERILTNWIAGMLGMTVDKNIFRGIIPAGKTGACVVLGSEIPTFNQFRPKTYNLQILGKFKDRDDAFRMLSKLSGSLPLHEVNISNMRFKSISQQGGGEPYRAEDDGKYYWYASFNATAVILTNGVQV